MIEEKAYFVGTESFFSPKKERDFYVVYVVSNHKPVTHFVTREVYDKINLKKIKEFSECVLLLETRLFGSRVSATLVDIK